MYSPRYYFRGFLFRYGGDDGMKKFILATDSGCDLPITLCKEKDIHTLFLTYQIDGQIYTDTMEHEKCKEFFYRMRKGAMPSTSQVNPMQYLEFWRTLMPLNLPIVHISLGSAISGTYANGLTAKEMLLEEFPEAQVHVVDSTIASTGYGLLAIEAAKLRDADYTAEQCVEWLEQNRSRVNTYYTTENLTHLHRSGRVSKAGQIIGSALKINPIMHMNHEGKMLVAEKVRGSKATKSKVLSLIASNVVSPETQTIYISHADCIEKAQEYGEALKAELGFKDVYYTYIGSTIGSHTGPDLIAIFYLGKTRSA